MLYTILYNYLILFSYFVGLCLVSGNLSAGWVSRGRTANQWATAAQGCRPSRSPA